jgi:hypothetical protein
MLETLCLEIDMLETCWRLLQCIRIPDPAVIMQTCKAQYTCGTRNNIKTHMLVHQCDCKNGCLYMAQLYSKNAIIDTNSQK